MADPNVTVVDGTGVARRAVLVSNLDGEILFQENANSTNAMVKLPDGSLHRVMLVANLADGSGSISGASTATDVSVNKTGLDVITLNTAQGAFEQLDSAVKDLQDSVSVLTTSVELATELGGSTVVLLDELEAMEIDGRPSYKEAGATVYGENGVVGIISTVDNTNQTANVKTVIYHAGRNGGDSGIKGDYCTTYGIISMPNGVITSPANNNTLEIPAGIMLKTAGSTTLTTLASETVHDTTSITNFTLFYAEGEFLECGDVVYSYNEPTENGVTNFQAWFNPMVGKWQFRSNSSGNVWREAIATPLCDCIFTNGNITRIDFIGYRVLNKQEFEDKIEVPLPPTANGTYILKATVTDGVIVTQWIEE